MTAGSPAPSKAETRPPTGIAAASALAHPSRRRIADALAAAPAGLTVAEMADAVGLHHNAVRQHLQTLSAAGVVSVERDAPRGRGRPSDRYRLIDPEAPRLAAHTRLVGMLVALLRSAGISTEDAMAFGRAEGRAEIATGGGLPAVADGLARMAFAPRDQTLADARREGLMELELGSCPFREAVRAPGGEMVCSLHHGLIQGMLDQADPQASVLEFVALDPDSAGCRVVLRSAPPQ